MMIPWCRVLLRWRRATLTPQRPRLIDIEATIAANAKALERKRRAYDPEETEKQRRKFALVKATREKFGDAS